MKAELADVTVVVDRSGSMISCQFEAENGLNHFIEEQKKQPGECLFTLVQFDTEYEFVHKGIPIKTVPTFKLVPRGMTALMDAVGKAINETGIRLEKMNEADRPALVAFVIVTDGHENASHEFDKDQIKEMIQRQQDKYNWKFTFLGANQNAFDEASKIGISIQSAAHYNPSKSAKLYSSVSANLTRMRSVTSSGGQASSYYTDEERESME